MPNEYRIEKIIDFAKVPDDRLKDCLMEFGGAMLELRELAKAGIETEAFTWIDDEIPLFQGFNLRVGDGEPEYIENPNFPKGA